MTTREQIIRRLEGEALQPHADGVPWRDFYRRHVGELTAVIRADPGGWSQLRDRLLALLVSGETSGQYPAGDTEAHMALPKGKHGAGLRKYAKQLGKSERYIGELWQAGEVLEAVKTEADFSFESLLKKAEHLLAIHAAPGGCWPALVVVPVADVATAAGCQSTEAATP
jgi:hypothetical protein